MQIVIGTRRQARLLRQGRATRRLIRKAGVADCSRFESRYREIRGFDQRGRCGDECAAEKYLQGLLRRSMPWEARVRAIAARGLRSHQPGSGGREQSKMAYF